MKKKLVFRIGAVLLSAGFMMNMIGGQIDGSVQAADTDEVIDIAPENPDGKEDADSQDGEENAAEQPQQTEPFVTWEEVVPETESEAATEATTEPEAALTSVVLNLDPDLETVPAAFLEYLSDLDVCSVTLVYADGSEKPLDKEDGRYEWSVSHADETDADGSVRRTYHTVVKERATGTVFEDTGYVEPGSMDPVEIRTEDMTTVVLNGSKKWMMVQSVPEISGRYAMNCDREIETIYYASADGEMTCAEDAFQLQEGETYQFLIKLK